MTTLRERLVATSWLEVILLVVFFAVVGVYAWLGYSALPRTPQVPYGEGIAFDGAVALQHVAKQMDFGRRDTGTPGWTETGAYIVTTLRQFGWTVETQEFTYRGATGRNIIGKKGAGPVAIIGAHYDTRRQADQDPDPNLHSQPVPGANDGASGVGVLLELARSLDPALLRHEVWLAFFDAEDNGNLDDWDWIVGSTHMADNLTVTPEMVIVVDMVGDADQQLYYDGNSDAALREQLWQLAAQLGYGDVFIPTIRYTMTDDHVPFARRGISAVDIIDFDYPYWHTTADTLDKVSADSLLRVGRVVETYLEQAGQ